MKMIKNLMALALAFTFVFVVGGTEVQASPSWLNESSETSDQCTDCHTNMDDKYDHSNNDGTWTEDCEYCHSIQDYDGENGYYTDDETKSDDQGDGVSDEALGYHGWHPEGECYDCHVTQVMEPETHGGSLDCGNCHAVDTGHAPPGTTETPSAYDPTVEDTDGDGLTNAEETGVEGYAEYPGYGTDRKDDDSDDDGIKDGAEVDAGLDPLDPSDAALDNDKDGFTNAQEIEAGTDMEDADSDDDGVNDGFDSNPTDTDVAVDAEIEEIVLEEGEVTISGTLEGFDATKGTVVVTEDAEFGNITFDLVAGTWTYTQEVFEIDSQSTEIITAKADTFTIQYPNTTGALVAQTVEVTVTVTENVPAVDGGPNNDLPTIIPDTDGDRVTDDVDADDDNDGFTDAEEADAGTNPLDPKSFPVENLEEETGETNNPSTGGTALVAFGTFTAAAAGLVVTRKRK